MGVFVNRDPIWRTCGMQMYEIFHRIEKRIDTLLIATSFDPTFSEAPGCFVF